MKYVACSIALFLAHSAMATGVAGRLSYQGRIIKPDGNPLEAASVIFTLQVRSPNAANCILYEETHTLNMNGTGGVFHLTLGTGTRGGDDPGLNFKDVFSNAMNFSSLTCDSGTTYTPATGHVRKLKLTFNDGSGAVAVNPDMDVQSVPYAFYAEKLQGKGASDLLQVNTSGANSLTQGNLQSAFTNTNYPKLMDIINGVSTQYMRSSPTSSVGFNSQRITNLADPTAAQDAATKNYCDANMGGNVIDDSDIASGVGDGKVLTWDAAGNKWVAEDPVTGMDNLGNHTATQDLDMDGSKIITLADPSAAQDAATKNYVDTKFITKDLPAAPGAGQNGQSIRYNNVSGAWEYYTPISAGADNLGDHTATQNIELGPNYISGDGDNEGIYVSGTGQVAIGTAAPSSQLHVHSATNSVVTVSTDAAGSDEASLWFVSDADGTPNYAGIGMYNDGSLRLSGDAALGSANMVISDAGNVGIGTTTPNTSALLDVSSTTKGFLSPRMTTAQRDAIASPTTGLQIYNTTDNRLQYYNGSAWVDVGTGIGSSSLVNTPAGNIAATTVQAAINELDTEKVAKGGDTMTGALAMSTNKITGLGDPTAAQDAATKNYVDGRLLGNTLAAPTGAENGKAIRWNGSAWEYFTPSSGTASSSTQIIAGDGLTGGGDLSTDRTLTVGAGTGISVAADSVSVDINGVTAEATADNADKILIYDNSATSLKSMTRGSFLSGVALTSDLTGKANDADVLKKDGSVALTSNWDVGNRNINNVAGMSIGAASPDASAALDVSSTAKGFLPPRMTTAQRTAIPTPAEGLIVYDTDTKSPYIYKNAAWAKLADTSEVVFRVSKTAAQSIATGTTTLVNWQAEAFDSIDRFDLATDQFNPDVPGYYYLHASIDIADVDDTRYEAVYIFLNGAAYAQSQLVSASSGNDQVPQVSAVVYLNGGTDYVDVRVLHNSTTSESLSASSRTVFQGFLISGGTGGGGGGVADHLGNHTATQNIALVTNWLSGDGDPEGLSVDGSGNVGIGTSAPNASLEVKKDADTFIGAMVSNPNAGASAVAGMYVSNGTDTFTMALGGTGAGRYAETVTTGPGNMFSSIANNSGDFIFRSGAAPTEKMRITNAGSVGIGSSPAASAILDVASTTKGFLAPRMDTTQRNAIASPATGLQIYNTSTNTLQYYNGSAWTDVGTGVGVSSSRAVNTGNGLTGGGDLSADRTIAVNLDTDPGLEFNTGALRVKAGSGITRDASGISHADTSSQASVDNANGTVIQDITLDTYGHLTGVVSLDLDGRYFTETEANTNFVNVTGDTMTGALTIDGGGGVLGLKPGTADHVYAEFYADTGSPATRSAWLGFGGAGSSQFSLANEMSNGLMQFSTTGASGHIALMPGGKVGIGTSSPGNLLTVKSTTANNPILIDTSGDAANDIISSVHIQGDGDDYQGIQMSETTTNTAWQFMRRSSNEGGSGGSLQTSYYNGTAWSVPMTILPSGNVGIGATAPGEKLEVNGNVKAAQFVSTSDATFKKNIRPIEGALERILAVEGVTYDWKRDEYPEKNFSDRRQYGVIAQQVQKIFPELVNGEEGNMSVSYTGLVAPLIEAVKEQQGLIEENGALCAMTQDQIARIQQKVDDHERRIASLEEENRELQEKLKVQDEKIEWLMEQVELLRSDRP